ncbi:hypothetical protein N7492_000789 [Penicillium capsulatum]|uniref:Uncharacterized protein n=1 Tax=Penicillium capsulatum TaxID=69766 RepID=A0A9W9LZ38_9EURO|nr:hypothetical protein N7492_000789 [Penicillium capsulatum]KAJ6130152.1 hypothetical protein N7512_002932 [Penicillium capsulatum]
MATAYRLRASGLSRYFFSAPPKSQVIGRNFSSSPRSCAASHRLPKIADTSVWTSMIPRFIRNRKPRDSTKSKEWNPATFYIIMFTLIGSQAIRMLSLKNGYAAYTRTTDAKIELLKEVIERVQKGEKVDVERLLGTGDEAKEKEWDQVLREIEQEDTLWQQRSAKQAKPEPVADKEQPTQNSQGKDSAVPSTAGADGETMKKTQSTRKLNFF